MASPKKNPSADAKEPVAPVANFSKDEELSAYRTMLSIRRFEEKAGQMYGTVSYTHLRGGRAEPAGIVAR